MKTILVPTDFSDAARNASRYAVQLAKEIGSSVLLFHVYHIPVPPSEELAMAVVKNPDEYKKENIVRIKEEALYLSGISGVPVGYEVIEGLAVNEIITIEKRERPYLIIMGMQTSGPLNEFLFGSVATDVIRETQMPVIIVPEKYEFREIKKVVFADDHSSDPEISPVFREILEQFSARVFILHVEKEKEKIIVDHEVALTRIEKYFANTQHIYELIENEELIHGIVKFIEEYQIDMVAMLPHRHNLFERLFKESQTKKMAFHTSVPLFVSPIQTDEIKQ
jgi:nucleotide-binding universal stress UspA family protein